jgi:hypothetical protein
MMEDSMATLEIELNCLCLFVPDPRNGHGTGAMHVLMPHTNHHRESDRHVVRLEYEGLDGKRVAKSMDGWALALGRAPRAVADTSLDPDADTASVGMAEVVDLTKASRNGNGGNPHRVDRRMVYRSHPDVSSRITFYGGGATGVSAESPVRWSLNDVLLAHQVVWRIDVPAEQMRWTRLNPGPRRRPAPPLPSLELVRPVIEGTREVFRLHVFHVTRNSLEERHSINFPSVLSEPQLRRHFEMFYRLMGIPRPRNGLLPILLPDPNAGEDDVGAGGWACRLAQAELQPLA